MTLAFSVYITINAWRCKYMTYFRQATSSASIGQFIVCIELRIYMSIDSRLIFYRRLQKLFYNAFRSHKSMLPKRQINLFDLCKYLKGSATDIY